MKPMTTREAVEATMRERERLDAAIGALGDGAATIRVTAEGWTAKDVLGHLIHWAGQIAWGLGAPIEPPAYVVGVSGRPSDDEWNARAVEYWRAVPYEEVRAEFDRVVDALLVQIRRRTDDQMNATDAIPWAGARPLWQQIGAETFEHWPEHRAALERAAALEVT